MPNKDQPKANGSKILAARLQLLPIVLDGKPQCLFSAITLKHRHNQAQDKVVADLGLGGLQLAQLDASKALVR